jgi:peptide chain release factor 3
MAADCAVMVIDLAKGVESQTEKLFKVCALRKIPVITFVNKVDRPGIQPLEVLEEVETKLGIQVTPQNWPLGFGPNFVGLVDMQTRVASLFDQRDGARRIQARQIPLDELDGPEISESVLSQTRDEVDLLSAAGTAFDRQRFLAGELSPLFFGSALTNWGVEAFLKGFLKLCPPPIGRGSDVGVVPAVRSEFAGFVFKIQANLDPRHRDRVAFLRVCSGRFEREMEVFHPRSGKKLKLKRAHRVFGQDRETMDEAFPGDIIGLVNPGEFHLGDTICVGPPVQYEALPQFSPEFFAVLRCPDTMRRKQFERGLIQLLEEGAIQMFVDPHAVRRDPILAAVGELQFDVVKFRLESEYNARTEIEWLPYKLARWVEGDSESLKDIKLTSRGRLMQDQFGNSVILFHSDWDLRYTQQENRNFTFLESRASGYQPGTLRNSLS